MPTDTTTNPTETRTANPATSATCGGGAHSNSQWGGHVLVENVIEVVVVAKGLFENTFCVSSCVRVRKREIQEFNPRRQIRVDGVGSNCKSKWRVTMFVAKGSKLEKKVP